MPDPGVSLIPRGSKSTKKKRTSFRPGSKKSNQKKIKTATALSTKTSKASVRKNDGEPSAATSVVAAVSKLPARSDSSQTTTESAVAGALSTTKTNRPSEPVPSTTGKKASQSLSKGENDRPSISEKDKTLGKAKTGTVESTSSRTTGMPIAITPTATKISNRKRKSTSLNKKISIGSSFRRTTDKPTTEKNETTDSISAPASKPAGGEEKDKDPKASDLESKKHRLMAAFATSHCIVPAFSEQDQAILDQVASEVKEKGEKPMNLFCTVFKGKKRKLKDKDGSKNSSNSENNGDGENSADGATKSKKDSSAVNSDALDKRVDATTTGAPSVQIIDGEIVLQESSVELPARRTIQELEEEYRDNVVEEDEQLNIVQASYTSFITKGDHGKTRKKGSWTIKETEKFYFALQQLGTDFGSMEALFFENQRTRKQLKNKYRRELAKNPDLVEELALNPKYQTKLDMAAFNLEVDPKRIEAHANEEPPEYEPTDENAIETIPSTKSNGEIEPNPRGNDYNGVFEAEVVEEDAEEERRAEALGTHKNNGDTRTTTQTISHKPDNEQDSSFWSTKGEDEKEFGAGPETGGFPRESDEGPSMDDFFGDAFADNENPMDIGNEEGTKQEDASTPSSGVTTGSTKKETPELVSLVPKKTGSKSRRPKIRPSRRKK